MVAKEDDPFLLGPGKFSVVNSLLNFQGVLMFVKVFTLPQTNMDTQNDGVEKVTPFKNGNFWYQFVRFLGCITIYIYIYIHISTKQLAV